MTKETRIPKEDQVKVTKTIRPHAVIVEADIYDYAKGIAIDLLITELRRHPYEREIEVKATQIRAEAKRVMLYHEIYRNTIK